MGRDGMSAYLQRTVYAYREFIQPFFSRKTSNHVMYPMRSGYLYLLLMFTVVIGSIYEFFGNIRKGTAVKGVCLVILTLMLPFVSNFIYVICDPETVYSLMLYGQIIPLLYAIQMLGRTACLYPDEKRNDPKMEAACIWRGSGLMSVSGIFQPVRQCRLYASCALSAAGHKLVHHTDYQSGKCSGIPG